MTVKTQLKKATHLVNNAVDCLAEALSLLSQVPAPTDPSSAEAAALVAACARLDSMYRSDIRFANKENQ